MECPLLPKCEFFHDVLENMPSSSGFMKKIYCRGVYGDCARYQVFQVTKETPPVDLFPNDSTMARKIIARHRRFN